MHIAVCDDEILYQDAVAQAISRWKRVSGNHDTQITLFKSSDELLEQFERPYSIDLLFLDIKIPGEVNGLEFPSTFWILKKMMCMIRSTML